jgi:hypothetical protein
VQLGAVDYLVKPFDEERLRKSLLLFQRRMAMLGDAQLSQGEVDQFCSNGPNALRWLPRTLSSSRLDEIRAVLERDERPVTAEAVAAETGVARVTARPVPGVPRDDRSGDHGAARHGPRPTTPRVCVRRPSRRRGPLRGPLMIDT